ncbi:MAG TPA: type II toxin-antitoxin system VapC family toxin [Vicinamibacterales bacterium]|nr:type II toxin-antitoxin system VapC family toxin [Vicinamibacterales bacterium]
MPDRVADASAVAAVLFGEEGAAAVTEALRGHTLYVPRILEFEVANAAWKRGRRFPQRMQEFEDALEDLVHWPLQYRPIDRRAVLRTAWATGLTVYDASYLWLARFLGIPLVTLDKKLAAHADRI